MDKSTPSKRWIGFTALSGVQSLQGHVDNEFKEIDTTCSICYEDADYQLNCGHIFHKRYKAVASKATDSKAAKNLPHVPRAI